MKFQTLVIGITLTCSLATATAQDSEEGDSMKFAPAIKQLAKKKKNVKAAKQTLERLSGNYYAPEAKIKDAQQALIKETSSYMNEKLSLILKVRKSLSEEQFSEFYNKVLASGSQSRMSKLKKHREKMKKWKDKHGNKISILQQGPSSEE